MITEWIANSKNTRIKFDSNNNLVSDYAVYDSKKGTILWNRTLKLSKNDLWVYSDNSYYTIKNKSITKESVDGIQWSNPTSEYKSNILNLSIHLKLNYIPILQESLYL